MLQENPRFLGTTALPNNQQTTSEVTVEVSPTSKIKVGETESLREKREQAFMGMLIVYGLPMLGACGMIYKFIDEFSRGM